MLQGCVEGFGSTICFDLGLVVDSRFTGTPYI